VSGHVRRWARRLTVPRTAATWAAIAVIVGTTAVVLWQLHPSLLLANTTTDGGDMGAHVMLPAFLETHLLNHGRLTGWDPAWYDGFPAYTFYFPLPPLLTVALNAVVNYNVAFKLVTVLGSLTLPLAAWSFGKLTGLRDPGPGCLAAATLPFLFASNFTIDGGNLLSTLAGESSYSLALSLALVFLGLTAYTLRTGRHRVLAAVLLCAVVLSHVVVAVFAVAGALLWVVLDRDLLHVVSRRAVARPARSRVGRRLWRLAVVVAIGSALSAWWVVPFLLRLPYTTNMGWQNLTDYVTLLFPASERWLQAADLVALVAWAWRRSALSKMTGYLSVLGAVMAGIVCLDPQGKLYNVRFLPLWFVCAYLVAGMAVAEVVSWSAILLRRRRQDRWARAAATRLVGPPGSWAPGRRITRTARPRIGAGPAGAVAGSLVALAGALLAVVPPLVVPAALSNIGITVGADQPSAWATWNYTGYQEKPDYPEYRAVVEMMAKVGADHGCGRAMWEYSPTLNRFGTTMALMLLPYWTNGCIDSMEGLLFESSATTPYHFLDQSELSETPSDAMAGLPYAGVDVPLGIEHLQMLGVRYFLASSPEIEQAADADPSARLVASTGPWRTDFEGEELVTTWDVYRIARSPLVVALHDQPVVWTGVQPNQSSWLAPSVSWYQHPSRWDVVPAEGGPAAWRRVPSTDTHPPVTTEPATTVTGVSTTDESVRFHVSRTGTPVEVRVSYFPNWHATGAAGPWRVAPNLMVVVPTSHEVVLDYGTTDVSLAGWTMTLAGVLAGLAILGAGWRVRRRATARRGVSPG